MPELASYPNGRVYVVSAARTPIGKFGGALSGVPAVQLGGVAIRAAIERAGLPEGTPIDEVLMGQVLQAGVGQAPARQAALRAGLPDTTSATTINRVCGSGLKAIMLAAAEIRAGDAEVAIAGGMESMNGAPYLVPQARFGYRLGNGELVDATVNDGLWCAIEDCHMGTHAERVAIKDRVSRADQDAFALTSHERAIAAIDAGRFQAETAAVTVRDAKGRETVVTTDEGPRRDTSLDALSRLKPTFALPGGEDRGDATQGTVTAGNAPGITDGAAATVVASERAVERLGLTPLARIVGYAQAEVAPKWLFLAPVDHSAGPRQANAVRIALRGSGMSGAAVAVTAPVTYTNETLARALELSRSSTLTNPFVLPYFPCAREPRLRGGIVEAPSAIVSFPSTRTESPTGRGQTFTGVSDIYPLTRLPLVDSELGSRGRPIDVVLYDVEQIPGAMLAPPDVVSST